jgi:hypothetical protein
MKRIKQMEQFKLIPNGTKDVPFCVNCKHYSKTAYPEFGPRCTSNDVIKIHPVTGDYSMESPYDQRRLETVIKPGGWWRLSVELVPKPRHCGPEGKFFEAEDTFKTST